MPDITYRFEKRARRPGTWVLLGLALGLEIFAVSANAPLYVYLVWGACTAGLLWYLWSNPQTVLELSDTQLRSRQDQNETIIPLETIAALRHHHDADNGATLSVQLKDGQTQSLMLSYLPPITQLKTALADHNILLHQD